MNPRERITPPLGPLPPLTADHQPPRPQLRPYPHYQPSGVEWLGEIPAHWGVRKLKNITRFAYGDSLSAENREEGDVPVCGSNGVVGRHSQANTMSPCIIVGRKGSYGKVNYFNRPCFAIDTTFYIDKTLTDQHLRWLYYTLSISRLDNLSQDIGVPGLSREEAYARPFPLPPLPEQRAIVAYLDRETERIDRILAHHEKMIELLEERRTATISRVVTRGLHDDVPLKASGVDWLGEIPVHWNVRKLKYLTNFINGAAFKPSDWQDEGVPIVRIENLNGGGDFNYTTRQLNPKYLVKKGDLLFGWSGNKGTSFGPFIWQQSGTFYLNQHIFRLADYKFIKNYFYWLLKAVTYYVETQVHGIIGLVHITKDDLGNIKVPFIPLQEQHAIAEYLDRETSEIDKTISQVRSQIELLREYRTTLITSVVTGKVDVSSQL